MKKYFMTMVVMAIFAIGFAASDDDSKSSNLSPQEQQEKEYSSAKHDAFSMAPSFGKYDAEKNANDYIRMGYSKSDLEKIATTNAKKSFKDDWKPGSFKPSEMDEIEKEYVRLYVEGYMNALGGTIYK